MPKLKITCVRAHKHLNLETDCATLLCARKALNNWMIGHRFSIGVSSVISIKYDGKDLSWNGRYYDGKLVDKPRWASEAVAV